MDPLPWDDGVTRAPPQLNRTAFATCIAISGSDPGEPPDLPLLKARYNFSKLDGLLPYFAGAPVTITNLSVWLPAIVSMVLMMPDSVSSLSQRAAITSTQRQ